MDTHIYFAFVVATTLMIALPGPSVLLTVANAITFGWHAALFTVAGATVGIACQLLLAAISLSSILHTVANVFEWIKWAGAAYLIYLGIRQWPTDKTRASLPEITVKKTSLFMQGVIVTIPNPKSLIFIAAFLPQFIDTTRPLGVQFACIVPTFLVITFCVTAVWALVAGKASDYLQSTKAYQTMSKAAAGLLIIAGIGLGFARRGN